MKTLLPVLMLATTSFCSAVTTIFNNQFNGTWSGINNGTPFGPVANYTPSTVGSTFSCNADAVGATWTVDTLIPQPWSAGGVIFTGGGITTGKISTSFNTVAGWEYTVLWDVDVLGAATTTNLIAQVGAVTQIRDSSAGNDDSSFTFTGTGAPMTLSIGINAVGAANASSDVQVDYVQIQVPEPSAALLGGLGLLGLLRRRR